MTSPWIEKEPATASVTRSQRLALNDPWVRYRWKPTVTPMPATIYITAKIAISIQDSQPPQAIGTAAINAMNGMTTKAQRAIMMPVAWRPSVSGLAVEFGVLPGGSSRVVVTRTSLVALTLTLP